MDRLSVSAAKKKIKDRVKRPSTRTVTVVDLRFVGLLLASTLVVAVLAHFWHGYQVGRLSNALIDRATSFAAEEKWGNAVNAIEQYLVVYPSDSEAVVLYAQYFRKATGTARLDRSFRLYDRALGVASDEQLPELQVEQAEILLELHRANAAYELLKPLLAQRPDDPDVRRVTALAKYVELRPRQLSTQEVSEQVERLREALRLNQGDASLSATLAEFLRSKAREPAEANKVIAGLLAGEGANLPARLAAIEYYSRFKLPELEETLEQALEKHPKEYRVLLAAGHFAARQAEVARQETGEQSPGVQQKREESIEHFRAAIDLAPRDPKAYVGLTYQLRRGDQTEEATKTLRRALRLCKEDPALLLLLAEIWLSQDSDEVEGVLQRLDRALNSLAGTRATNRDSLQLYRDQIYAEWLLKQGRSQEATALLERVALSRPSARSGEAGLRIKWRGLSRLGSIYASSGRWDQAARTFDRAVAEDPNNVQLRIAAADAWSRSNQATTAAERYRNLLRLGIDNPQAEELAWIAYARELHRIETRKPEARRNWGLLQQALQQAQAAGVNSWGLRFVQADLALSSQAGADGESGAAGRAAALEFLRRAEQEHPMDESLLARLAIAYQRIEAQEDADRAIALAEEHLNSPFDSAMLRSELARLRGDLAGAVRIVENALNEVEATERPGVVVRLADLKMASATLEEKKAILAELSEQYPTNPNLPVALLELILSRREGTAAEAAASAKPWLDHLGSTSADGTLVKYYQARVLLLQAASDEDPSWLTAVRLQADLEASRPGWSKSYLLKAFLSRAQGNHSDAAEALKQAVRLGETAPEVVVMLTDSLYRLNELDEATRYLSMVQRLVPQSDSLSSLAISVAVGLGERETAVDVARRRVAENPEDPVSHIRLGQTLLLAERDKESEELLRKRFEEAEREFLKAIDLAPEDMRAWNGLFSFYVSSNNEEDANKSLMRMVDSVEMTEAQREFALAQGHEILKHRDQALSHYERAAKLDASNPAVRCKLAEHLLRDDPQRAVDILRPVAPKSKRARLLLAMILASLGGEEHLSEALELMQGAGSSERRTRAVLLASYGDDADRLLSRELFEDLVKDSSQPTTTDRLLLARLYEQEGKTQLAREQFRITASQPEAQPLHAVAFVEFLVRHEQWDDALLWLKQVDPKSVDAFQLTGLRARVLQGSGKAGRVEEVIDGFVQGASVEDSPPEDTVKAIGLATSLASNLRRFDLTEKYMRLQLKETPNAFVPLALAIARQGRAEEAVELCLEKWREDSKPQALQGICAVLMIDAQSPAANEAAEPVLVQALQDYKDNVGVLNLIGAVRHLQGRPQEAISAYGSALKQKPGDATTINNLVTLLSEIPERREKALQIASQALRKSPKSLSLLDVKAVTLFHQGDYAQAEKLLKAVTREGPKDARYWFHLALVQQKLGKQELAGRSLQKAEQRALDLQILTPAERELLAELSRAVGTADTPSNARVPVTVGED